MPRLIRVGGIVSLELSPPLDFIEAQHGVFRRRLDDFHGLWDRFARTLASIGRARFATGGFGEWPPLAESTLQQKTLAGFPPFPLIRTGRLYESLTDAQQAARMWPDRMTWGTDVPYAQYHQAPTDPGHPPERKVLDLRVVDRRRLEQDQIAWLNEIAAETFGRGR